MTFFLLQHSALASSLPLAFISISNQSFAPSVLASINIHLPFVAAAGELRQVREGKRGVLDGYLLFLKVMCIYLYWCTRGWGKMGGKAAHKDSLYGLWMFYCEKKKNSYTSRVFPLVLEYHGFSRFIFTGSSNFPLVSSSQSVGGEWVFHASWSTGKETSIPIKVVLSFRSLHGVTHYMSKVGRPVLKGCINFFRVFYILGISRHPL